MKTTQIVGLSREQCVLLLWTVTTILLFQLILGYYAVALNELFYAKYGSFPNSSGYYNALAFMQIDSKSSGMLAALSRVIYSSTVVYPWALFAPFARHVHASRADGVWIQIFAATCMQLTLVFYFLNVRGRTWAKSIAFSTAFVLIPAAFNWDGGLSDFRMDLLQYLLLTTVMACYLIARKRRSLGWFALLGGTIGLFCLVRAFSPVYLVPIFAICVAVDLVGEQNRRLLLRQWLMTCVVATTISGWYFASNFSYLFWYYAVWNPDAHAHLPLAQSATHLKFAVEHIGIALLLVLVVIALDTGVRQLRVGEAHPIGGHCYFQLCRLVIWSSAGLNSIRSFLLLASRVSYSFCWIPLTGGTYPRANQPEHSLRLCFCLPDPTMRLEESRKIRTIYRIGFREERGSKELCNR